MKLSICMMVKNEEKHLLDCLHSISELYSRNDVELVLVDTGSTDGTISILIEHNIHFGKKKWFNDFSGMRNYTISLAKGEWILIIDGDEVLEDISPILDLIEANSIDEHIGAFSIKTKNLTGYGDKYILGQGPRVFRNDGDFQYTGIVHNQPQYKGKLAILDTSLIHYGYINTDSELMERKFSRTRSLIQKRAE